MAPFSIACGFLLIVSVVGIHGETATGGQPKNFTEVERSVYDEIAKYVPTIRDACESVSIDPRLVTAILFTEKVQYVLDEWLSVRNKLEAATAEFRVFYNSIVEWADLSAGYCRIKPTFASETALRLREITRERLQLGERDFDPATYASDPGISIRIMCASLAVFRDEWRTASVDLTASPEILATLYNIGFDVARPHGNPRSGGSVYPTIVNGQLIRDANFGDRVRVTMESAEWIHRMFQDSSSVQE